ncbi:MAG: peptidoglycan DD-metalloendopeptidase family protein [Candidatus Gracilibacteria bacterium]|nr:peptidoglycan DD-metalloendopeptidase family protein [Candidatus Gracilibacteria bacterium]
MAKNSQKTRFGRDQRNNQPDSLPWLKMLLVVGLVFFTGLTYMVQQFGDYFTGSIVGQQVSLLSGYNCPQSNAAFEASPIPDLFAYQKGNNDYNRRELLRINQKNHGLTAWMSYDKGFAEATKAQMIDSISYASSPEQYLSVLYESIKNDGSPHGAVDFVTKWLSPDNHYLKTVYPYAQGLVVEVKYSSSGYGNHVMVCTDVVTNSGQTIRVLYGVAHLETISVEEGQTLSGGALIGTIGSTGSSTTPHAHITIHPDLVWQSNYKSLYNAGYNFYYANTVEEILVKTIDPVSVLLNPSLAYSIVSDDTKRQKIFAGADQYFGVSLGEVALNTDAVLDSSGASILDVSAPVFESFRVTSNVDSVLMGEQVSVNVEALDQNGARFTSFNQDIDVVLSSTTATFNNVSVMDQGYTTFTVTDTVPGEVVVQVNNQGSISAEKKVTFLDKLSYLEVTAPQKTTVGSAITVVMKPIGTRGGLITRPVTVRAQSFPLLVAASDFGLSEGRGEYTFKPTQEGIFELSFTAQDVVEKIQVTVQKSVEDVVEPAEPIGEPLDSVGTNEEPLVEEPLVVEEEPVLEEVSVVEETTEVEEVPVDTEFEEIIEEQPVIEESNTGTVSSHIVIKDGDLYEIHNDSEGKLLVYYDQNITTEFPIETQFTVPENTHTVSIFTGLNSRNYPDTGELKLTKYTPGQEVVRYYPKHVGEDTYKKIIAYDETGTETDSLIFTWSPMSQHVFTDVVKNVTDDDIYAAVAALKEAGVVKGNPDGTYGVETSINRAAVATILIRSFYSDVDLLELAVAQDPFPDVKKDSWYASAMYFASLDEYDGQAKSVIIKGRPNGTADPDGLVKLEEFLTMVLRVLDVQLEETTPWYESAVKKSIELGFISDAERDLIDKPLARGLVARIMVAAIEKVDELVQEIEIQEDGDDPESLGVEIIIPEEEAVSLKPVAVSGMNVVFDGSQAVVRWENSIAGPFTVYRETVGGAGEILIGQTGGAQFTDQSAKAGKQYYYRVEYNKEGQVSERAEYLLGT